MTETPRDTIADLLSVALDSVTQAHAIVADDLHRARLIGEAIEAVQKVQHILQHTVIVAPATRIYDTFPIVTSFVLSDLSGMERSAYGSGLYESRFGDVVFRLDSLIRGLHLFDFHDFPRLAGAT